MVASLKEFIDELVTICLATSLEDAGAIRAAGDILDRLLALEVPVLSTQVTHDVRCLSEKLRAAERIKSPSKRHAPQLLRALEELSHTLYTLAADPPEADVAPSVGERSESLKLPPEVDSQIFSEFLSNARLTVDDLEQEIEAVRQGISGAVAAVKRRIHTLKGEAGMLGLRELEYTLHCTETYLEQPAPAWERTERLLQVRDWVCDAIVAYSKMRHPDVPPACIEAMLRKPSNVPAAPAAPSVEVLPRPEAKELTDDNLPAPAATALQVADTAATEDQSAPTRTVASDDGSLVGNAPMPNSASNDTAVAQPGTEALDATNACPWVAEDTDLVVEFLHEADEHLGTVDQALLDMERNGIDGEHVNKLFRAFHTLKGVAAFLHLQQFKELTHTTETMLDRIRGGAAIPQKCAIDLVFDATAMLRTLATAIQKSLTTQCALSDNPDVPELIRRLQRVIEGEVDELSSAVPPAAPGERLGEILVRQGVVDKATIIKVLEIQKATGHKLGEELIAQAVVPAKKVAHALRAQQMHAEVTTKLKEVVKVDLDRVDHLVEAIGELVIVESMVSNAPEIRQLPAHLRNYLGQFAKITRELQELGMCMRMVPVRTEFQKMARIMRDLARRCNKFVRMELVGESTEMDRMMVEQIADPLVHLIRNAVDHGIELPAERKAAGKPETGTVRLSACHEGGSIIIEISDDGRGIDRERVLAKAIAQGIVDKNAVLSDAQVFDLIFAPGFSTAQQVTEISGRGVGMDVVKRNIEAIRGRVITSSAHGRGTTFRVMLPLTLAIIDGMVVRCGSERFIVPTLNIVESLQPSPDMLFRITGTHEHILVRGKTLPLVRLDHVLDVAGGEQDPNKALVVIVESLRSQIALLVDEVVMKQQVVIKTLSNDLDTSHLFAGAAILSNGRVGLILNIESLIDMSHQASLNDTVSGAVELGAVNRESLDTTMN